jgi:hypothetical protein
MKTENMENEDFIYKVRKTKRPIICLNKLLNVRYATFSKKYEKTFIFFE